MLPGGDDFHRVAPHSEGAPGKLHVVAAVLDVDQAAQQVVAVHAHAGPQGDHLSLVLAGVAHGIDAAHRRDDNHVPALLQGGGGAVAQAVDFLIDGGVLLDVGIGGGDVRLGLVVIVIGNEVLHPAVGEEGLQLRAELGRQGFVVGDDQGGLLHPLDHRRHGEGFAGARHAQQHLAVHARRHTPGQGVDGLGLVAAGLIGRLQHKLVHSTSHDCEQSFLFYHSTFPPRGKGGRFCFSACPCNGVNFTV